LFYASTSGFIAQTERAAEIQSRQFGPKLNIRVIPNAIELIGEDSVDRKNSILFVGRLSWEKGVDRLINAFARMDNKSWTLDIVGDGPANVKLQNLTVSLGCSHRVTFHGKVQDPTLHYLSSSIFVLPSQLEGFPNAMCEAMSAGLPCICFDSIPFESIVENDLSGIVVKKDDVGELASSLDTLIQNPNIRKSIGQCAKETVQRFKSDAIAQQYLSFMGFA
jgi:glycosyltransferase involved in cell wall biosynthesis